MRNHRIAFALAALIAWGALPTAAVAATLLTENFIYPDGNLAGQGTWTAHSGAGVGPVQVVSQAAVSHHGPSATFAEDVNTTFVAQGATAKTYASFDLKVTSYTSGTDYFAHLKDTGTSNLRSRVFITAPTGGGSYSLGIAVTSAGTSPTVQWPADLTFNQTYRIVQSYDAATGTAELWVDPANEASSKIVSGPFAATGTLISSWAIRQGSGAVSTQEFDNLLVGQSFDDIVPAPVPGLSPWGAIMLAFGMCGVAGLFIVQRRRALA